MVGNVFSIFKAFLRCARLEAMLNILNENYGGDLDEKIDFQNFQTTCALILQIKFLEAILMRRYILLYFQREAFFKFTVQIIFLLGLKDYLFSFARGG